MTGGEIAVLAAGATALLAVGVYVARSPSADAAQQAALAAQLAAANRPQQVVVQGGGNSTAARIIGATAGLLGAAGGVQGLLALAGAK